MITTAHAQTPSAPPIPGLPSPDTAVVAQRHAQPAAPPVTFAGTCGLFVPAAGGSHTPAMAALFVSPWGYEEMCARKFYRILAEDLGRSGIASLRFDYPGTGDALDPAEDEARLDIWFDSIAAAAAELRRLTGVRDIVLIGQGLGAALAHQACDRIADVAGLALLAPVLSGRGYLRELFLWAQMTEGHAQDEQKAEGSLTVGALTLSTGLVCGIRGLNLTKSEPASAPRILVAARPERPAEADFAKQLSRSGKDVTTVAYDGYDQLVGHLTFSTPPARVIADVTGWATSIASALPVAALSSGQVPAPMPVLRGDGFIETHLRFGENDRLLGILCEPADGARKGATVLMLTTAYERMSGWGRVATMTARDLARAGIATMRYDAANVADSPPLPGAPTQILYSDAQHIDVDAAMAVLEQRQMMPVVVAGRCSGGYLAFRSAVRDRRFSGSVAVNPYVFYWDGSQSVEELLLFVPQPIGNYGFKMLKLDTWKRIINGEVNLKYGIINTMRSLGKRSLKVAEPLFEVLPNLLPERREVLDAFRHIRENGTDLSLMYSDNDVGLDHLHFHFGDGGQKLARYSEARLTLIPDADHSLTTHNAREVYEQELRQMALKFPPGHARG